jgi:two-component system, NarL family, nitrate/nitrite response regulator NarL
MNTPIRIVAVDDHAMFRESLVRLLETVPTFTVLAHCSTLQEAALILPNIHPDVVLLDYDLGTEVGTDLLTTLRRLDSNAKVLIVTGGMRPSVTIRALEAGVSGLILKQSNPHQLVDAIRRVAAGETWWDTGVLHQLGALAAEGEPQKQNVRTLTERQQTVLKGILDGLTNKEIAFQIGVSETSVKSTIQELFSKAGVRTRGQLVRVAIETYSSEWLSDQQSNN